MSTYLYSNSYHVSNSYSGLDEVTLYPIEQRFHSLYCYAEKEVGPSEISRLKLMDENGNVIMQVNGFAVSWTVVLNFKDVAQLWKGGLTTLIIQLWITSHKRGYLLNLGQ